MVPIAPSSTSIRVARASNSACCLSSRSVIEKRSPTILAGSGRATDPIPSRDRRGAVVAQTVTSSCLSPAEELKRGKETNYQPAGDHSELGSELREICPLQHVGAQGVDGRGKRE